MLSAHSPMNPVGGIVLFTASPTVGLPSAADSGAIYAFTNDKFSWTACCTCDFGLSHWMSWAMCSCCSPQGLGVWAGSRCCQLTRKLNGYDAKYDNFVVRDVGQLIMSPIAWKRRVNQQEIHQHSTKSLLAYNCIKQLVYMHTTVQVLYSIKKSCMTDGGCVNTENVRIAGTSYMACHWY